MAVVDLKKTKFCTSIRKKLKRDMTVYPLHPGQGAGCCVLLQNGIYQMRRYPVGIVCVREKFYQPSDQTQPGKIPWQNKFAAAVLAWQGLTSSQKIVYNKRAVGTQMSGYNLFIKIYIHG